MEIYQKSLVLILLVKQLSARINNQRKINETISKGIKQNWTGPKNFGMCFCVILTCYEQSLNLGRALGTRPCLQTTSTIS